MTSAWRALRGAGSVTDRSCSLQRMVERSRFAGVTWERGVWW